MADEKAKLGSKKYIEVLGEALVDKEVREKLLNDPEQLAKEKGLSAEELETLRNVDRAKLEEAARSLGGETTADIKIVIGGTFSKAP